MTATASAWARGVAAMDQAFTSAWGQSVTYSRAGVALTVVAIAGEPEPATDLNGQVVDAEIRRTFEISLADLAFGERRPQRGDLLTEEQGGIVRVWEVLPDEAQGRTHYQYSSGFSRAKVFTKLIEERDAVPVSSDVISIGTGGWFTGDGLGDVASIGIGGWAIN